MCWVLVGQYDLYLPGPREEFFRTGRLTMRTMTVAPRLIAVSGAEASLGADGDGDARGLGRTGVGAVGVDDEAALAGTVGDRHAERLEQRVVVLGRSGRSS